MGLWEELREQLSALSSPNISFKPLGEELEVIYTEGGRDLARLRVGRRVTGQLTINRLVVEPERDVRTGETLGAGARLVEALQSGLQAVARTGAKPPWERGRRITGSIERYLGGAEYPWAERAAGMPRGAPYAQALEAEITTQAWRAKEATAIRGAGFKSPWEKPSGVPAGYGPIGGLREVERLYSAKGIAESMLGMVHDPATGMVRWSGKPGKVIKRAKTTWRERLVPLGQPEYKAPVRAVGAGGPEEVMRVLAAISLAPGPVGAEGGGYVDPRLGPMARPAAREVRLPRGAGVTAMSIPGRRAALGEKLEVFRTTGGIHEYEPKWGPATLQSIGMKEPGTVGYRVHEVRPAGEMQELKFYQKALVSQMPGMEQRLGVRGVQALLSRPPTPRMMAALVAMGMEPEEYERTVGKGKEVWGPETDVDIMQGIMNFIRQRTVVLGRTKVLSRELLEARKHQVVGTPRDIGGGEYEATIAEPFYVGRIGMQLQPAWKGRVRVPMETASFIGAQDPRYMESLFRGGAQWRERYTELSRVWMSQKGKQAPVSPLRGVVAAGDIPWDKIMSQVTEETTQEEFLKTMAQHVRGPVELPFGAKRVTVPSPGAALGHVARGKLGEMVGGYQTSYYKLMQSIVGHGFGPLGKRGGMGERDYRQAFGGFWRNFAQLTQSPQFQRAAKSTVPRQAMMGPVTGAEGLPPHMLYASDEALRDALGLTGEAGGQKLKELVEFLGKPGVTVGGLAMRYPFSAPITQTGAYAKLTAGKETAKKYDLEGAYIGASPVLQALGWGDFDADDLAFIVRNNLYYKEGTGWQARELPEKATPSRERTMEQLMREVVWRGGTAPSPGPPEKRIWQAEAVGAELPALLKKIGTEAWPGLTAQAGEWLESWQEGGKPKGFPLRELTGQMWQMARAKGMMAQTYPMFIRDLGQAAAPTSRKAMAAWEAVAGGPYQQALDLGELSDPLRTLMEIYRGLNIGSRKYFKAFHEWPEKIGERFGEIPTQDLPRKLMELVGQVEEWSPRAKGWLMGGEERMEGIAAQIKKGVEPAELAQQLLKQLGPSPGAAFMARETPLFKWMAGELYRRREPELGTKWQEPTVPEEAAMEAGRGTRAMRTVLGKGRRPLKYEAMDISMAKGMPSSERWLEMLAEEWGIPRFQMGGTAGEDILAWIEEGERVLSQTESRETRETLENVLGYLRSLAAPPGGRISGAASQRALGLIAQVKKAKAALEPTVTPPAQEVGARPAAREAVEPEQAQYETAREMGYTPGAARESARRRAEAEAMIAQGAGQVVGGMGPIPPGMRATAFTTAMPGGSAFTQVRFAPLRQATEESITQAQALNEAMASYTAPLQQLARLSTQRIELADQQVAQETDLVKQHEIMTTAVKDVNTWTKKLAVGRESAIPRLIRQYERLEKLTYEQTPQAKQLTETLGETRQAYGQLRESVGEIQQQMDRARMQEGLLAAQVGMAGLGGMPPGGPPGAPGLAGRIGGAAGGWWQGMLGMGARGFPQLAYGLFALQRLQRIGIGVPMGWMGQYAGQELALQQAGYAMGMPAQQLAGAPGGVLAFQAQAANIQAGLGQAVWQQWGGALQALGEGGIPAPLGRALATGLPIAGGLGVAQIGLNLMGLGGIGPLQLAAAHPAAAAAIVGTTGYAAVAPRIAGGIRERIASLLGVTEEQIAEGREWAQEEIPGWPGPLQPLLRYMTRVAFGEEAEPEVTGEMRGLAEQLDIPAMSIEQRAQLMRVFGAMTGVRAGQLRLPRGITPETPQAVAEAAFRRPAPGQIPGQILEQMGQVAPLMGMRPEQLYQMWQTTAAQIGFPLGTPQALPFLGRAAGMEPSQMMLFQQLAGQIGPRMRGLGLAPEMTAQVLEDLTDAIREGTTSLEEVNMGMGRLERTFTAATRPQRERWVAWRGEEATTEYLAQVDLPFERWMEGVEGLQREMFALQQTLAEESHTYQMERLEAQEAQLNKTHGYNIASLQLEHQQAQVMHDFNIGALETEYAQAEAMHGLNLRGLQMESEQAREMRELSLEGLRMELAQSQEMHEFNVVAIQMELAQAQEMRGFNIRSLEMEFSQAQEMHGFNLQGLRMELAQAEEMHEFNVAAMQMELAQAQEMHDFSLWGLEMEHAQAEEMHAFNVQAMGMEYAQAREMHQFNVQGLAMEYAQAQALHTLNVGSMEMEHRHAQASHEMQAGHLQARADMAAQVHQIQLESMTLSQGWGRQQIAWRLEDFDISQQRLGAQRGMLERQHGLRMENLALAESSLQTEHERFELTREMAYTRRGWQEEDIEYRQRVFDIQGRYTIESIERATRRSRSYFERQDLRRRLEHERRMQAIQRVRMEREEARAEQQWQWAQQQMEFQERGVQMQETQLALQHEQAQLEYEWRQQQIEWREEDIAQGRSRTDETLAHMEEVWANQRALLDAQYAAQVLGTEMAIEAEQLRWAHWQERHEWRVERQDLLWAHWLERYELRVERTDLEYLHWLERHELRKERTELEYQHWLERYELRRERTELQYQHWLERHELRVERTELEYERWLERYRLRVERTDLEYRHWLERYGLRVERTDLEYRHWLERYELRVMRTDLEYLHWLERYELRVERTDLEYLHWLERYDLRVERTELEYQHWLERYGLRVERTEELYQFWLERWELRKERTGELYEYQKTELDKQRVFLQSSYTVQEEIRRKSREVYDLNVAISTLQGRFGTTMGGMLRDWIDLAGRIRDIISDTQLPPATPPAGYQFGGEVPGPPGVPRLARVHGGEEIIPADEAGKGRVVYHLEYHGNKEYGETDIERLFKDMELLADARGW